MNWVCWMEIKTGQRIFGLEHEGRIFMLSNGMTVKSISTHYIEIQYDFGEVEQVSIDTNFLVR